jgi:hypothetical protein
MERLEKAMEKISVDMERDGNWEKFVKLENIATAIPMGNVEHTILDIHSILRSYYKVALKRFTDTVCMQGTDCHMLSANDSLLTPIRVISDR